MDKNIAIEFQGVGKQYRLGRVGTGTLQHDLNRFWQTRIMGREDPYLKIGEVNDRSEKAHSDYVWALKDINFKVEQGDVVGIIGKNGAGKSTLLKLLSHITAPSTGDIFYRGRIASLLEVGTGFHGELTGKENIFMNGAVLGMTKHEIKRKLDDIIEFAGVEKYIDTPVKRYSSGMTVRLGFAVAAFLEPEILVVDEVLTVGDAEFQKRAIGKMDDVAKNGGRTVLFVSHNMTSVRSLCNNGILLENGTVKKIGKIDNVVDEYIHYEPDLQGYDLTNYNNYTGKGYLKIGKVEISTEGEPNGIVYNTKPATLRIEILNPEKRKGALEVAGSIKNQEHIYTLYFGSRLKSKVFDIPAKETSFIEVTFERLAFVPKNYYLGLELKLNGEIVYSVNEVISFEVKDSDFYKSGDLLNNGIILTDQEWRILH